MDKYKRLVGLLMILIFTLMALWPLARGAEATGCKSGLDCDKPSVGLIDPDPPTVGRAHIWPACDKAVVTVSGTGIYTVVVKVNEQTIATLQVPPGSYPVAWPEWVTNDICNEHQASVQVGGWTHGPVVFGGPSCCELKPVVLQQNVNGYTGAQDTWLNQWMPGNAYPRDPSLRCHVSGAQVGLLRFDLSAIPNNATIVSATLSVALDAVSTIGFTSPESEDVLPLLDAPKVTGNLRRIHVRMGTLEAYRLLRAWSPAEANWNAATATGNWELPGANGQSDRESAPAAMGSISLDLHNIFQSLVLRMPWYHLDVTALVQEWVSDPESNLGVQLRVRDDFAIETPGGKFRQWLGGYPLVSSEFWSPLYRPKLTLIYTVP